MPIHAKRQFWKILKFSKGFFFLFSGQITQLEGCLNNFEPYSRQSRANTFERPYTQVTSSNTIVTLNGGELSSVRPNLYTTKGQILYGRYVITFLK